jgi:hypothetical protein
LGERKRRTNELTTHANVQQMERKERDLGFFNGIKAELIPLAIGLASFTLLADQAINQLGSLFNLDEMEGIYFFIGIYFIAPVVLILLWLTWVNNKDGLKEDLIKHKKSLLSILVLAILVSFPLMIASFFLAELKTYLVLSLILLGVIFIYLAVVWGDKRRNYARKREYRQAGIQMVVVVSSLLIVWTLYFHNAIKYGELKTEWANPNVSLREYIDSAAGVRKNHRTIMKASNIFISHLRDFTTLPRVTTILPDSLSWDRVKSNLSKNFNLTFSKKKRDDSSLTEAFKDINKEKLNTDSLHYVISRVQEESLKGYKHGWVPWLLMVQFKGLLLFNLLVFFLLVVWYHSYKSQLLIKDGPEYSETNISKVSVYFLFLLIIPFFKPFEEESITFGKPYLGNGDSVTNIFNSQYKIEEKPCVCPEVQEFDYEKAATEVRKKFDSTVNTIDQLGDALPQNKKAKKNK